MLDEGSGWGGEERNFGRGVGPKIFELIAVAFPVLFCNFHEFRVI